MTPPDVSANSSSLQCRLVLPARFRVRDMLAFHGRDSAALAERVEDSALHKGILWQGAPARLSIRFEKGAALVDLAVDGARSRDPSGGEALAALAARMLGLTQPIEEFEERHVRHPRLGVLIARNRGLRIPLSASPFEALCWAITGQQISVSAAISIRRRLIQAAGPRHSSGLLCFPDAAHILALGETGLRQAGFSRAKAASLGALCEAVDNAGLPLEDWLVRMTPPAPVHDGPGHAQVPRAGGQDAPAELLEEVRERLLALRGIGPWTVAYALLRGYGALDGSLHGDVAVRRNLQILLGSADAISAEEARRWLEPFSPWRALLAAHLWAMQTQDGY